MASQAVTAATFEQTALANDIVLVDWWASWCRPCRMFAPVFEAASVAHPDIVCAKVDTEAEQSLAGSAQITSIPTLMGFRERLLVFSQPGALASGRPGAGHYRHPRNGHGRGPGQDREAPDRSGDSWQLTGN